MNAARILTVPLARNTLTRFASRNGRVLRVAFAFALSLFSMSCASAPARTRDVLPQPAQHRVTSLGAPGPPAIHAASSSGPRGRDRFGYPDNRPGSVRDTLFGVQVPDPYRWLENAADPDVKAWLSAEDRLARSELAKLPEREAIARRLKELLYVDDSSAPVHRGARYFFARRAATSEKAVVYFKQGKAGRERVLLDPNTWSTDGSRSLGNWTISPDGNKVAYTVHQNNEDEATLHVLDVTSGLESPRDRIAGAKYASAAWLKTSDGFFYTWLPIDPALRAADRPGFAEVRFHQLGRDPTGDRVVHEKTGDPSQFIEASVSEDGNTLFVAIQNGWSGNELYFRDLRGSPGRGERPFIPLARGFHAHYVALAHRGSLYVTTDEAAPHWKVMRVDPEKPERAAWTVVVAEDAHAAIDDASILGGKLVLAYLIKATSRLEIHSLAGKLAGKLERVVELPGIGTASLAPGREGEDEAYFDFQSFTTPHEVHALSVTTGKTSLYSRVHVPVDAQRFVVDQVTYPSKDGTPITMFLIRDKDLKRNADNRVLLYGYGGFQVSLTPTFSASLFPWLERGGVYAVANLRGGGEYGEAWHAAGTLHEKQNVFDDFAAAAEYLIESRYTRPERLAIFGASNGGLLVGAALTQHPQLFAAVVCGVPLLDMIRYQKFGSGSTWAAEYGSVANEPEFRDLLAYSPYHHVTAGTKYPALLLLSADSDDRVDPMHARKFAAALQDASTGGPVLLRVERNSGHGGADLRRAELEKNADRYAFALRYTDGESN